jgi:hypothetical protein
VGEGRVNGKGEEGQTWWKYFVHMYESRAMKPVEIVRGNRGRWDEEE